MPSARCASASATIDQEKSALTSAAAVLTGTAFPIEEIGDALVLFETEGLKFGAAQIRECGHSVLPVSLRGLGARSTAANKRMLRPQLGADRRAQCNHEAFIVRPILAIDCTDATAFGHDLVCGPVRLWPYTWRAVLAPILHAHIPCPLSPRVGLGGATARLAAWRKAPDALACSRPRVM